MYEELHNVVNWEKRLPTIAREFGQTLSGRQPVLLFGPRYFTHLFSPQPRLLEQPLRRFGQAQCMNFPEQWQSHWPGRDQERLYFLLEYIEHRDHLLRSESRAEHAKSGIFHWHAGPVELDLILPTERSRAQIDPRLTNLDGLASLALFRIGSSYEEPVLASLTLAEAIRSIQQVMNDVKEALGFQTTKESSSPQAPLTQSPTTTPKMPRRDAWLKA